MGFSLENCCCVWHSGSTPGLFRGKTGNRHLWLALVKELQEDVFHLTDLLGLRTI